MDLGIYISLSIYFLAMLSIGWFSLKTNESSAAGYLLGGRKLSAPVTALSAGASDMSGWILMGVPGAMYVSGISSFWIAIGLIIGAWINYLIVAPRLRVYTQIANDAITLPDFFEKRFNDTSSQLRIISSLVIVLFFALYTSAGVVSGGKLFESAFGLSYHAGIVITASIVVAYTFMGGFTAVSLTDFVQGILMFIALLVVPAIVIVELGGPAQALEQVKTIDSSLLNMFTDANTSTSLSLISIISLLAWGLGYFGQPHILVRFMAINSVKSVPTSRRIAIAWMTLSLLGASATGLFGLAYVSANNINVADPETIFILLSQLLFNSYIGGFFLAAILAAIMSTISSQLLVSASSLSTDIYANLFNKKITDSQQVLAGRLCVVLIAVVAVLLATDANSTILSLVSIAWAGFGAAFGPLVLFCVLSKTVNKQGAISGIIAGAMTVMLWKYVAINQDGTTLSSYIYEIIPAFIFSSITIALVSKVTYKFDENIDKQDQIYRDTYLSEK